MVAEPTTFLIKQLFGFQKLLGSAVLLTIDAGYQLPMLRFHVVGGVLHNPINLVKGRQCIRRAARCLFRIPGVIDNMIRPAGNGPN